MYEAKRLRKTIFPQCALMAVLLCLATNSVVTAATPGLPFTEDFTSTNLMDASTTANWLVAGGGTLSLADRNQPNDPASSPPTYGWATAANIDITAANNSAAAALGDLDGDGALDLVVANKGQTNQVYLNKNDGSGGFFAGADIGSEVDVSTSLALGDVDGDGDLDLVVANVGQSNKRYLNDGDGNFEVVGTAIGSETDDSTSLALGDVDGDGDLDLVVANVGQSNKRYLNDGDGNFEVVGTAIGSELDDSTSLALGDVDGDGDLDLIVGNTDEVGAAGKVNRLYMNDGSGGFSGSGLPLGIDEVDATSALALGDVDDDGDVDLVVANRGQTNKLYLNNGASGFAASGTAVGVEIDDSTAVALQDVDNDGDLDLVVGNENQTNKLYMNEGAGQFSITGIALGAETDASKAVCLGDVDGDGDLDVLVANHAQTNKLYENGRGAGFVAQGTGFAVGTLRVNSVAVADLDGVNGLDIVIGMYNRANQVYLNNGSGGFVNSFVGAVAEEDADADATYSVAIGDVDGDGSPDIVVGNYGGVNMLYLNDGSGKFDVTGRVSIGSDVDNTYAISLVNVDPGVDGDGDAIDDLDLVVGNNNQPNKLYLYDSATSSFAAMGTPIGTDKDFTYDIAVEDVDGDGAPDLITANAGQTNKLYLNNGVGGFSATATAIGSAGDGGSSLAVADVGSIVGGETSGVLDGRPDVVVGNYGQANKLYLNDGSGGFGANGIAIGGGADADKTRGLDLADVDVDGDIDLLVANDGQANKLYLNNGAGSFSAGMSIGQDADNSRVIKLVNDLFDSDGESEVLVGNYTLGSKFYRRMAYRSHAGRVVSEQINLTGVVVRSARLSADMSVNGPANRNTRVDFYLSNDDGQKWYQVKSGLDFVFPALGSVLRWKAELNSLSPMRTPVLNSIEVLKINLLPVFTATPSIEGTFAVDEILTVVDIEATDPEGSDVDISYQWQADGEDIPDATAATYTIPTEMIDAVISLKVSADDGEDGVLTVETAGVSKAILVEPTPDTDPVVATVAEEASAVVRRTGGGSLGVLSLVGLMLLLSVWRGLGGSSELSRPTF